MEWVWLEAKICITTAANYFKLVHQEITAETAKTEKWILHYLSIAGLSIPYSKILLSRSVACFLPACYEGIKIKWRYSSTRSSPRHQIAVTGFHHADQWCKPVPTEEATWAPEVVWMLCKRNQYLVPAGNVTTFAQTSTHSLVPIPTVLSWLPVEYGSFVYAVICRTNCSLKKNRWLSVERIVIRRSIRQ
jgi:hypothetical protein